MTEGECLLRWVLIGVFVLCAMLAGCSSGLDVPLGPWALAAQSQHVRYYTLGSPAGRAHTGSAAQRLESLFEEAAPVWGVPDSLRVRYYRFSSPEELKGAARVAFLSPMPGDPDDYAVLETEGGRRIAVTLTCAANATGRVPEGDWARGDLGAARAAFAALGSALDLSADDAAEAMIGLAAEAPAVVVEELIAQRGMSRRGAELIAGGGGASALVPAVGERLGLSVRLAPNASVISAIGTALALVREVVERTVPGATEQDVLTIRREAVEAVVRQGADPNSVSVDIEYDSRSAVLRATASGQTELRERDLGQARVGDEERKAAAAKSLGVPPGQGGPPWRGVSPWRVELAAEAGLLRAYQASRTKKRLLGLLSEREQAVAVVDEQAVVRLILPGASALTVQAGELRASLPRLLDSQTRYGDAGAELPQLFLGVRGRIVNLSGLVEAAQVLSLAEAEMAGMPQEELVLSVVAPRSA